METDNKAAEDAIVALLKAMKIDPAKHPGIKDTPKRVVKMLNEVWEGERYSNDDIAKMFGKNFPTTSKGIVIVKDIPVFSYCEHHLALMYNMRVDVGYIPSGRVIGLSKVARIAEMCAKRLQLQEKLGRDILDVMGKIVGNNVIVRVEAEHSCVTARGIKKPGTKTVTLETSGIFDGIEEQERFLNMLKG